MLSSEGTLSPSWVKAELRRLRRGQALAHPAAVMRLDGRLRRLITGDSEAAGTASEVLHVVSALSQAIGRLGSHERLFAQVDFNLDTEHSYPTLTDRQESLARERRCAAKTVRRHADEALDTLALIVASADEAAAAWPDAIGARTHSPGQLLPAPCGSSWRRTLCDFWRLTPEATVDVVCSEIPESERPGFALPSDRNYLRYARFADLDSLIYVRTRLAQACPDLTVRDFLPSEHVSTDADSLIVIGRPPWNSKFRDFAPLLPFRFELHPLDQDHPLLVPQLGDLRLAPRWSSNRELLEDIAVFTRLTLARGTTIFLLGGCFTLGVLAAAHCFLHRERGAMNAAQIRTLVGGADFVLVVEARRVGGITDVADLARIEPLLLLARHDNKPFQVLADRTERYLRTQRAQV